MVLILSPGGMHTGSHNLFFKISRCTDPVLIIVCLQIGAAQASETEMHRKLEIAKHDLEASRAELKEAIKKREDAEAAKFAVEGMLRNYRGERKTQVHSGIFNGGHPLGSPINGDRHGYIVSPTQGNSQTSSPSHPSFSFATFASPSSHDKSHEKVLERSPTESLAQALEKKMPSEEKHRRQRLSSKIGSYFIKKKDSGSR